MSGRDSQPTGLASNLRSYRCFFCDEEFSGVDATNHFGRDQSAEPACKIKAAGEFALLQALRNAEDTLSRHRADDSDTQRAMYSMIADHSVALRREEEKGYARGLKDAQHVETSAEQTVKRVLACLEPSERYGVRVIAGHTEEFWAALAEASTPEAPDRPVLTAVDYAGNGPFTCDNCGLTPDKHQQPGWFCPPQVKTACELGIESHRGCDCKKPAPPTCTKHGVELAFDGDGCWECSKEER